MEGHVVDDADDEVVFGLGECQVLVDAENLCGGGVLRRQTVAAAHDEGSVLLAVEGVDDVEEEGLAVGAGLLGAVEDGDALHGGGDGLHEVLHGEGTVEVNGHEADFLALGGEGVDGLLGGLGDGAHGDDDALGIGGAVVVEELVLAAGDAGDFLHIVLDDAGDGVVVFVGSLAVLEEDVGVLGGAAGHGVLGVEGAGAELGQGLAVNQSLEFVGIDLLDFLNLVGGAEAVEEVHEGHAAFDGGQVGDTGQVHDFLHGAFSQHGKAGLAA